MGLVPLTREAIVPYLVAVSLLIHSYMLFIYVEKKFIWLILSSTVSEL